MENRRYIIDKMCEKVEKKTKRFLDFPRFLETTLENKEYLCSDRFTIADICVSYAFVVAKSLGIEQAFKPNITRYTNMLFKRDAFKRSVEYKYEGEDPSVPSD